VKDELLPHVPVKVVEPRVVSFYALVAREDGRGEFEALFVEPDAIGTGHGRELLAHARVRARSVGVRS
jgi:N-acetylglutamate synthase-like GNAT family acetyltransferase